MNKQDKISAIIDNHLETARDIAINEVIRMARQLMRNHKNLHEFIIAMGSYFFIDDNNDTIETTDQLMNKSYEYYTVDSFKYFKPLNDFISKWDDTLKLTGEGIRFTADGEIITDW